MTEVNTDLSMDQKLRNRALLSSRVFLLVQWPAYIVLGVVGVLLPALTHVDEAPLIGAILLALAFSKIIVMIKTGPGPGTCLCWRAGVTVLNILAALLILVNPFSLDLPLHMVVGAYMVPASFYVVLEGRYSFLDRRIEIVTYSGFLGMAIGVSVFAGVPDISFWTPTFAYSLYLLILGYTSQHFTFLKIPSGDFQGAK
ncbi:hypothetical protein [Emcibacter nanhaiensis]|uniref:Uncharacterized protein n=1 Tax=Emcibacter nanhaiensis TaxID=1505037 RepID=A0A501PCD2_9PROT|nr:hypothetical protein [Emcibacter nanhaiensis]TPD57682.1 hypothetical protein FIV46_16385 [Emcibacter nanhaiensis]